MSADNRRKKNLFGLDRRSCINTGMIEAILSDSLNNDENHKLIKPIKYYELPEFNEVTGIENASLAESDTSKLGIVNAFALLDNWVNYIKNNNSDTDYIPFKAFSIFADWSSRLVNMDSIIRSFNLYWCDKDGTTALTSSSINTDNKSKDITLYFKANHTINNIPISEYFDTNNISNYFTITINDEEESNIIKTTDTDGLFYIKLSLSYNSSEEDFTTKIKLTLSDSQYNFTKTILYSIIQTDNDICLVFNRNDESTEFSINSDEYINLEELSENDDIEFDSNTGINLIENTEDKSISFNLSTVNSSGDDIDSTIEILTEDYEDTNNIISASISNNILTINVNNTIDTIYDYSVDTTKVIDYQIICNNNYIFNIRFALQKPEKTIKIIDKTNGIDFSNSLDSAVVNNLSLLVNYIKLDIITNDETYTLSDIKEISYKEYESLDIYTEITGSLINNSLLSIIDLPFQTNIIILIKYDDLEFYGIINKGKDASYSNKTSSIDGITSGDIIKEDDTAIYLKKLTYYKELVDNNGNTVTDYSNPISVDPNTEIEIDGETKSAIKAEKSNDEYSLVFNGIIITFSI